MKTNNEAQIKAGDSDIYPLSFLLNEMVGTKSL